MKIQGAPCISVKRKDKGQSQEYRIHNVIRVAFPLTSLFLKFYKILVEMVAHYFS